MGSIPDQKVPPRVSSCAQGGPDGLLGGKLFKIHPFQDSHLLNSVLKSLVGSRGMNTSFAPVPKLQVCGSRGFHRCLRCASCVQAEAQAKCLLDTASARPKNLQQPGGVL